jgi:hypothetical protein
LEAEAEEVASAPIKTSDSDEEMEFEDVVMEVELNGETPAAMKPAVAEDDGVVLDELVNEETVELNAVATAKSTAQNGG